MKKKVIGFVHTHWDREWYREFEVFRMRLLRVFDNVIEMLESNLLPSFYFDGQTSALEDYLEMRPEKQNIVKTLIKDKKLFIGPFYCLIDEFLTNTTVLEKNLEKGIKYSNNFGCSEFVGYFADTFGHTANVIPILKNYGINTAIVWRGCGDIPSEFTWSDGESQINCINLVRGYFNDFFTADIEIEQRTKLIKDNLDKIAQKSGNVLLMPIGGDHLGINPNFLDIVDDVNKRLTDYEIVIGSIFDYIELVKKRFSNYTYVGELRDNSKTFTLQGSFSSRLDLKKLNIETSYLLESADRLRKYYYNSSNKYENLIEYAYKLLLQNQAHDSIYGCSLDDVHKEDIIRYKKIKQIANTIIDELKFENNIAENEIINLGDNEFSGSITFESSKKLDGYQLLETKNGFKKELLTNTLKVPVTEDYQELYTYLGVLEKCPQKSFQIVSPAQSDTDVFVTNKCIGNSKIFLSIENNSIKIGNYELKFIDFVDNGDSYNEGPNEFDKGKVGKVIESKVLYEGSIRSAINIKIDINDILNIMVELDNQSEFLNFKIDWDNTYTNHKLQVVLTTSEKIVETYSEDMNKIIKREFNSEYDIRNNLPKAKGLEAYTNTAPMQRGVWANGVAIITNGLTQYEVKDNNLAICILRSTNILSNPTNPARTTPAGPPLPLKDLKQLGSNYVEFSIALSNNENLQELINQKYNFII